MRNLCSRGGLLGLSRILLALSLTIAGAGVASAATLNLGDVALGDTFVSGNGKLEFGNFGFDAKKWGVDPSDITLEILDDGLRLSGPVGVWGSGWKKFSIDYSVTALDPSMPIVGSSLTLDALTAGSPKAGVFATKTIRGERHRKFPHWPLLFFKSDDEIAGDFDDDDDDGHGRHRRRSGVLARLYAFDIERGTEEWVRLTDSDEFRPQDRIRVEDKIKVFSKGSGDAEWFSSTNRFSVVPEPGTASLMGLGLLGLYAAGRRR